MRGKEPLVKDLITKNPVYARPEDTVLNVVKRMAELHIGALPVVDSKGRLIGIFTERDLLKRVVAKELPLTTKVGDVMTPNPITVKPATTIREALEKLKKIKARHLPVVDDDGNLIGIISIKDIEFGLL